MSSPLLSSPLRAGPRVHSVLTMSDVNDMSQPTVPGPAEEADESIDTASGNEAADPERTTDADRTATGAAGGELDEAGEDEQIDGGLIDRALGEPTD